MPGGPFSPETHGNIIPPQRGGNRFDISAPPRSPPKRETTITQEPPPAIQTNDDPTRKDVLNSKRGNTLSRTERAILEFARKHPVVTTFGSLAALGTIGTGIVEAVNVNIPGIHRSVTESLPSDEVFDNKGVIRQNDTVSLADTEISNQLQQQITLDKDNYIASTLLPLLLPKDKDAQYSRPRSNWQPTKELQELAVQKDIRSNIEFNLPKDTTIIAPVGGHVVLGYGKEGVGGQDPTKVYSVGIILYDKENNITYIISIASSSYTTSGAKRIDDPLNPLLNIPGFEDKKYHVGTGWKDLPIIKQGRRLMKTTKNQQLRMRIDAFRGEKIGPEATLVDKTFFPVRPNFIKTRDNKFIHPEPE